MTATAPRAVVVGGGIAGLSAAYRLARSAREARLDLAVSLVEADTRLGGKILTERPEGLVIEGGPDSFLASKPAAARLCRELGIEDRLVGTLEGGGGTFILRRQRLEPLPEGITMLVPTKLRPLLRSRLLSTRAKLRMGLELFIPAREDEADESVGSFVRRRFGDEAFEHMAQPLLSGIYAGDADQLSLLATFPRLRASEREHGSLIRGMLAQRRAAQQAPPSAAGRPRSAFLSLRTGLGELIETLEGALDGIDRRLGVPAARIARRPPRGYDVHLADGTVLPADVLLLAIPAYAAADLVDPLAPGLAGVLREIPYVSTATVALAYRKADVGALGVGRGFVIPRVEQRELTAVTWVSSKFPGRAPDDLVLLRGFVGRAGNEDIVTVPDDRLLHAVLVELREILGLTATPVLTRIHRWHRALPQYVLGHLDRLAAIDRLSADLPGLVLLGSAYRGVGIPDCIESGEDAARRALALLSEAPVAAT